MGRMATTATSKNSHVIKRITRYVSSTNDNKNKNNNIKKKSYKNHNNS